jgi:hypothetical protein
VIYTKTAKLYFFFDKELVVMALMTYQKKYWVESHYKPSSMYDRSNLGLDTCFGSFHPFDA